MVWAEQKYIVLYFDHSTPRPAASYTTKTLLRLYRGKSLLWGQMLTQTLESKGFANKKTCRRRLWFH